MKISPSILNANFKILQEEIDSIASADRIHLDIMDGQYVPAKTFRASDVSHIKFLVPIEAHLMVTDPEKYFDEFTQLGCVGITFHCETQGEGETIALLQELQDRGLIAGICVDGYTDVSTLTDQILEVADKILVMSVKAGKGGQSFMNESLDKIKTLRVRGFLGEIEVDGGVNLENVKLLREVGADIVVVGSFLMKESSASRAKIIANFQNI